MNLDLSILNEAQRKVVTTTEGYVRVLAVAGSGKTRALVYRYSYLIMEMGIAPQRIVCTTFTNKAADEIKSRINALTNDQSTGYIGTIHGLCVKMLREDICSLRWPTRFFILSREDSAALLQAVADDQGAGWDKVKTDEALRQIANRKKAEQDEYMTYLFDLSTEDLYERYRHADSRADVIYYGFLYYQRKNYGLDYDDLILTARNLLQRCEDVRNKWMYRTEYIMVDEAQDLDDAQFELLRMLSGCYNNLMLVGDPDQTLYGWRGAHGTQLINFQMLFQNAITVMMTRNYRSTPQILRVANRLISKNVNRVSKDIMPMRNDGVSVMYHHSMSAAEESDWIASEVLKLVNLGVEYCDIAVIYRANRCSRVIELALQRQHIPYRIHRGTEFFRRKEVADAIAYLRLIVHHDDISLRRVINTPPRKIGKKRLQFLSDYAAANGCSLYEALHMCAYENQFKKTGAFEFLELIDEISTDADHKPVSHVLAALLQRSGYEEMLRDAADTDRLDNLAELMQSVQDFETECGGNCTIDDYLEHIALYTSGDDADEHGKVKLMTAHASKGLEFPVVFVAALNEGIFPSARAASQNQMEEERRAAFVAITRAQDRLYLSSSDGFQAGQDIVRPSRFLAEIGPDLLACSDRDKALLFDYDASNAMPAAPFRATVNMLPVGTKVLHPHFGEGTIVKANIADQLYFVSFEAGTAPRCIRVDGPLTIL